MSAKTEKVEILPYDIAKKIINEQGQTLGNHYLRRINSRLCCFSWPYKCFVPINDDELETYVISYAERLQKQNPKLDFKITKKFIQDTVFFIKRHPFIDFLPAEYEGWMGFRNGALNLNSFQFIDYNSSLFNFATAPSITFSFQETYDVSVQSELKTYLDRFQSQPLYCHGPCNTNPLYPISQFASDKTPIFSKFLNRISNDNYVLQNRIWEMIGYILSTDTNGKVFFLLQGVPNSGKSILGRLIESFFPSGLVTSLSANRLGDRFSPSQMNISRLNMSMDLPDGRLSATAIANIKMITGGDLISHEEKYKDTKASRWICKLLFSTNHPLELKKHDPAFVERIVCIPFLYEIPKHEQDTHLLESLLTEREYIINKALFCYNLLRFNNYCFSGSGTDIFKPQLKYKLEPNEIIEEFIKDCCEFTPIESGRTTTRELYERYKFYCGNNGFPIVSDQSFSQRFIRICGDKIEDSKWRDPHGPPLNGYKGVVLISLTTDEDATDYDYDDDYDYDRFDQSNDGSDYVKTSPIMSV